jgi:membrane fusion protein (multidrug efflux system)
VEFHLAERDSSLVRYGARVDVRVSPFPDEVFPATVQMISPTIDSRTRTLRVKAAIEDSRGVLKPGLFARADLGLRERSGVIMVPEESVILRSDGEVVFRLEAGSQVSRVQVTTGVHREGWIEIVSGLSAQDVVVVRGQARLVDGSVVLLRNADGGPPAPGSPGASSAQAAR